MEFIKDVDNDVIVSDGSITIYDGYIEQEGEKVMGDVEEIKMELNNKYGIGGLVVNEVDNMKELIRISHEEQCLYILGRKIDGFESLEEFLKYLDRFMELEEENVMLKKKLEEYEKGING